MLWTRRRRFVGMAGAALAAAPLRPLAALAAANGFGLAPRVEDCWARHQGDDAARLVQLDEGVRLAAGAAGAPDRGGLAIWSRERVGGDFTARFATRRLDPDAPSPAPEAGLFLLLYFGVEGDGTPGHPADLAAWPAPTVPYTHAYARHVRGARIRFHPQFGKGNPEAGPIGAAFFKADESRNRVEPEGAAVEFPARRGAPYAWTVRRAADAVTVTQDDGGTSRTVTFRSDGFVRHAGAGNLGLLVSPGRDVEVRGFAVERS